jgi:delta1-piperideine-2-carboxylate reductase
MKRPAMMAVDCDNSFAPHGLALARDAFVSVVREQGCATLVTRNAHHISALRHDVLPLAEAGLVAIMMSGAMPWVVPHGGRDAVFGTNPMAFACPRAEGPPIVWDQAASIQSISDVRLAAREGRLLETPVGLDAEGRATCSPEEIIKARRMLPFGEHKGTAIALMVEIMTAGLTGGRFAVEHRGEDDGSTATTGQFLMAIDPDAVEPGFVERLRILLDAMEGNGAARIPGDGRLTRRKAVEEQGVPISMALQAQLRAMGWPSTN